MRLGVGPTTSTNYIGESLLLRAQIHPRVKWVPWAESVDLVLEAPSDAAVRPAAEEAVRLLVELRGELNLGSLVNTHLHRVGGWGGVPEDPREDHRDQNRRAKVIFKSFPPST